MLKKMLSKIYITRRIPKIIKDVRNNKLTYLEEDALFDLYEAVRTIDKKEQPGLLIEAGCAFGGSAIVMSTAKSKSRSLYVYDVFGMIPPPSDEDGDDVAERYQVIKSGQSDGIDGDLYYGYHENLYEKVEENFSSHGVAIFDNNVNLVKGLFQDTMTINEPIALAHIDGDWYESVMTCLQRIEPNLVKNGILIIDDYNAWSGCRKAVDDFFRDKMNQYDFVMKSRLHIVRK
jgi:asparagine synthase (glutamine-hydrolysing)